MLRFSSIALAAATFMAAGAAQAECRYDAQSQRPTKEAGEALAGAKNKAWFIQAQPLKLFGDSYVKHGLPREFGAMDFGVLVKAADWDGVPVFTDATEAGEVMYVPVDPEACSFQPYQIDE